MYSPTRFFARPRRMYVWFAVIGLILTIAAIVAILYWPVDLPPRPMIQAWLPRWNWPRSVDFTYFPAIGAMIGGIALRWLPVNNGTRTMVKGMLLLLVMRYVMWRTTATLNFSSTPGAILSVAAYGLEIISLLSLVLFTWQTMWSTSARRSQQADRYEALIQVGEYRPSVDVLIPTQTQSEAAVRRTVMACQAMRYAHKTIYILDDRDQASLALVAAELGCEYLTRSADAGAATVSDLNHAVSQTHGELIAVIDANSVPFRNFLDRLVGFFHRSDIALVQTPQTFHHPGDRLGRLTRPPQDTGVGQSHRDVFGSVLGRGSCYVVRRQALMLAGGYTTAGASAAAGATASAAAGATSLNLWDQGGKVLYLDERLSLGESPQTLGDWLDRCWRQLQQDVQLDVWRRRRLSRMQKIVFASQLIQRLPTFCRLGWLLVPILSLQWGALPYVATVPAVVSYFLPFWVALVAIAGWTTGDRRSYFWAEVDAVVFCLPALVRLGRSWGLPLGAAPTRSASAIMAQRNYHWPHNLPLAALLLWTLAVALHHLWNPVRGLWMWPNRQLIPLYVWLGYNAVLLVAAIGRSIDQPLRRMCDRLPLQVPCRFLVAGEKWPASTVDLSEQGARLHILPQGFPVAVLPEVLTIELGYPALRLQARVVAAQTGSRQTYIQVAFQNLRLAQQRQLIELIYGSPLDWQQRQIVGGLPIWRGIVGAWGEPLRPISRHYR